MDKLKKILEIVVPNICALAAFGTFVFLIFRLTNEKMEIANREIILILIGHLSGIVVGLFGYWYGSSQGSKNKTELMNKVDTIIDKTLAQ